MQYKSATQECFMEDQKSRVNKNELKL